MGFLPEKGIIMGQYDNEIRRRRTFAIISHPDAGKTTLTEKFLLYGGAINTAGSVKGRKTQKHAVSDWMEIEKQRGISVTSSVLQFNYNGYCINLLDTPGHQDFSEDTYRTLMAADSAVMVIDGAKGVEPQTIKLFKVCVLRHIPIFTFVNKMDREINDPFSLLDEIENVLGIHTCPVTWPIGAGKTFQGVYDRQTKNITKFYAKDAGQHELATSVVPLSDLEDAEKIIGQVPAEKLREDMELLDGASEEFDQEKVTRGLQTPVFFGSALTNFGVGNFLDHFLSMTYPPMARESDEGTVTPFDDRFSAFVFKIQANMNKAHRDRIAFIRVVSGKFTAGMEVFHVQGGRNLRLTQPQQMMAEERKIIDEAYAGDIIGIFDPGIFHIGDTLVDVGEKFRFGSIPTFAPDHFARVKQTDTMKRKQFTKGIEQIALEGAVQIFKELDAGMEEIIVGAVGVLQFDVLKFRMDSEYHVEIGIDMLPYEYIRWVENPEEVDVRTIQGTSDMKRIEDLHGEPLLLFVNPWSVRMVEERNPKLKLSEFGNMEEFR